MRLEYEGADVTGEVVLERCVYEAGGGLAAPRLSAEFADEPGLWDRWSPAPGDRIRAVEPGVADTGAMFVERAGPTAGGYAVRASALPVPDARASREWRDTTLLTVAGQVAGILGLSLEAHGSPDMALARVRQADEGAMAALSRLMALSGCSMDVYDGALHVCAPGWAEAQGAAGALTLGDGSEYSFSRGRAFASCSLAQPESAGVPGLEEAYGEGEPRFAASLSGDVAFPGSAELRRACAAVLALENGKRSAGWARGDELTPFTPGSVCEVECGGSPSLSGRGVVTRVRNDFATGASKTWWRDIDG